MDPLVVNVEDSEAQTRSKYAFSSSPVRIGRGELNDLQLASPFASSWHGVFTFDGAGVRYVDLGSTNGTTLDGRRLERNVPVELTSASVLGIGPLRLTVGRRSTGPLPEPPRPITQFSARASGMGAPGEEMSRLVQAFAESYAPGASVGSAEGVERLLSAVAELLETSARSYLELRRGYEEFAREMGIRLPGGHGPLARAGDARALLAYLLSPGAGRSRAGELQRAYADLMMHQVALLRGVTEGAKALLARLSPEDITSGLLAASGPAKLAMSVRPLREGAQWREFLERYRALTDEEDAISDVLFGSAFARAYFEVTGRGARSAGRGEDDGRDDDGETDDET